MLEISHHFEAFPVLETDRCTLRELTDDDLPAFFEMVRQDEVTQYLPWDTAQTPEDADVYLQKNMRQFREQTGIVWGVVNKEQNALMGSCTLFNLNTAHHRAETGYMLGSAWWRQGYMHEVCARVVEFAFAEMKFHSLMARIDPANVGSQKLLEKLGFVQEGYFRENYYDENTGTFGDTAMFSLLASWWRDCD